MLLLQMAIAGVCMAVVPAAGCALYPAHVRASGFNLAHNIVMGVVGGLSPMTVTAIEQSVAIAGQGKAAQVWSVGIWLSTCAVMTLIGCLGLLRMCPQADYTEEVWRSFSQEEDNQAVADQVDNQEEVEGGLEAAAAGGHSLRSRSRNFAIAVAQ